MDTNLFLMIQNIGVAPSQGFTVFGVSTARDNENTGVIGKFGSGNKHGVNVCLRNEVKPIIFCGNLRLEFYAKQKILRDGITEKSYGEVHCRMSGKTDTNKTINQDKDLSFALEYGIHDWTDLSMALREFVSNAIDRAIRETKETNIANIDFKKLIKNGQLSVEVVSAPQVRAKAGYTRVFVPFNEQVMKFYNELGKRFLHFSEPESLMQTILPKRNRNLNDGNRAMIYRKGVFVREVAGDLPSLFDYNFGDNELKIDEARNVDDWSVKYHATHTMRTASPEILAEVFRSLINREKVWEGGFDADYLKVDRFESEENIEAKKGNWQSAWRRVAADAILVDEVLDFAFIDQVEGKGFVTRRINAGNWAMAAQANGVPTAISVLSKHEKSGLTVIDATPSAIAAVDIVWGWAENVDMTNGKTKPVVKCFRKLLDAETETLGFYEPIEETIYLNVSYADTSEPTSRLLSTALEEIGHYVTGSTDNSRDFQKYFMEMIVRMRTETK